MATGRISRRMAVTRGDHEQEREENEYPFHAGEYGSDIGYVQ
jgi:hypothetical protein